MYSNPIHSIDEALGKFELIAGAGDQQKTACAMTMLGWLAGHKQWTDHPICAHHRLADIVVDANDYLPPSWPTVEDEEGDDILTPAGEKKAKVRRQKLVELGYEGVLDTWWIPEEVIEMVTYRAPSRSSGEPDPYKYATQVLKRVIKWKKTRPKLVKQTVSFTDAGSPVYRWVEAT